MLSKMLTLVYDERQHERFRSGDLVAEWYGRYPSLFDNQDFEIVMNQARLGYHFFEWLTAITLYEYMGLLSIIEQYEYKSHKRKQRVMGKIIPRGILGLIQDHKLEFRHVQCPDLLVFAPDYSEWFFYEVKGPGDRLRKNQLKFFKALEQAGSQPIRTIRFHRFRKKPR
ncbi:hypothetical protein A3K72_00805 [Candidatus Woesearchaeota archaeon RBG_13_36_6]|nr:MAG: hypothetical protein A3K72_00805 [Candidatus Woesearchaeota archaeon RBG_13_36_6]